jgi:hypothetical protein
MLRPAVLALPLLLAQIAGAQNAQAQELGSCQFHLPREATTIVYGAYAGGLPSSVRLAGEKHQIKRIEAHIPKREKPVFIVLSAYDPVEWDLKIEEGADIAGLLVTSYHDQVVRNLPANIRYGLSSFVSGQGADCPKPVWAYAKDENYTKLEDMLDMEFSRSVNEFHGAYSPECFYDDCKIETRAPQRNIWDKIFGTAEPIATISPDEQIISSGRVIR